MLVRLAASMAAACDVLASGHFWVGLSVGAFLAGLALLVTIRRRYRVSTMTVGLPFGLGSVTYELSSDERLIAWRMYIQLTTRKAALPFDEASDVIADVYSSLYDLFPISRELLSSMRLSDVERQPGVSDIILRTLNDGLRPHLSRWNAAFRRWREAQLEDDTHKESTPQQIQQGYPHYRELVEDLKCTNTELSKFADELLAMARSDRPHRSSARIAPKPPAPPAGSRGKKDLLPDVPSRNAAPPTTPYDTAGSVMREKPAGGRST